MVTTILKVIFFFCHLLKMISCKVSAELGEKPWKNDCLLETLRSFLRLETHRPVRRLVEFLFF